MLAKELGNNMQTHIRPNFLIRLRYKENLAIRKQKREHIFTENRKTKENNELTAMEE